MMGWNSLVFSSKKWKKVSKSDVLYDGMIEFSTLSFDYITTSWKKLGIQAKAFSPISPFISTYYNYRDHRKIIVIDGKVGFTGGVNLADEYINKLERFGHWKDTAIMLEGEAVNSFVVLFLQMWSVTEKEIGCWALSGWTWEIKACQRLCHSLRGLSFRYRQNRRKCLYWYPQPRQRLRLYHDTLSYFR